MSQPRGGPASGRLTGGCPFGCSVRTDSHGVVYAFFTHFHVGKLRWLAVGGGDCQHLADVDAVRVRDVVGLQQGGLVQAEAAGDEEG